MKMNRFLFLMFILTGSALWSQEISFTARASKTEVSVNERFSVQFILSSDEGNLRVEQPIKLPHFDGLHQLAESQQSNFQIVNGAILNQSGIEVILVAEKEGDYTIGAASLVINGKRYKTKPISISVKQGLKPKVKPNQRLQGAFLTAEITETNPFVNQEVVLVVKLYARDYSILNRVRNYSEPDFANLITKFVSERTDDYMRQEIVNGQTYVSQELARYILFPQKSGELVIDPFAIEVIISGYYGSEAVQLSSEPLSLRVRELPNNKPQSFTGAVGNYKMIASLSKEKVKANEAVNLEVEIIGSGNLNTLKPPKIEISETIETYPPKRRDVFDARPVGMRGKVAETSVLVPQYGGNYAIGPIKFSFFDPKEERYVTLASNPLTLNVDGPEPPPKTTPQEDSLARLEMITDHQRKDSTGISKLFVPEKFTEVKDKVVTSVSGNRNWMWLLLSLIGLPIVYFVVKRNRKRSTENLSDKKLWLEFKTEIKFKLKQLKSYSKSGNSTEFYSLQEEILTEMGMRLTDIPLAEFTENSVSEKLSQIYSEEAAERWKGLLLESKQAKYANLISESGLEEKRKETETLVLQFFSVK